MKRIYFLLLLVVTVWQQNVFAERINVPGLELPKLIITEVRADAASTAYLEITNLGDTAINLDPFTIHSVHFNTRCTEYSDSAITFNRANSAVDNTIGKLFLKGIIQPGESFVVANVWDQNDARGSGIPNHNTAIAQIGKQFGHIDESLNENGWINKPEWQCFGKDSLVMDPTYNSQEQFLRGEQSAGYLIHWVYQKEDGTFDSTYIDQFNHFWYPDENDAIGINHNQKGNKITPIAGIVDAITTSVMIRKPQVSKGNLNWDQSRGTDALTSEWIVIPKNRSKQMAFSTVGSHGDYQLDYTVKDPSKVALDDAAKTISIPWEIVRGDSLARYFNLGEGMAWSYDFVGNFEDSASYIARTGDVFTFYAAGNELKKAQYTLNVREAENDIALVFPKRRLNIDEEIVIDEETGIADTVYTRYWSAGFVYNLSVGPDIDSIINVSYATRTDSLLKYLDKPEKATWEFVWVDGVERVDLKYGDKLKVTSENGANTKEYFIAVDEHVKNNSALLSAVTWPDVDKKRYPRWIVGDTLPEFTPFKSSYIIELRPDENKIPALQFKTQNLRAKKKIVNATSIDGTLEQRTTSVTVTSESDTISLTYKFIFVRQGTPVQPYIAEPFIAEFVHGITTQGWAVEIYNPGTEDLDLSRYIYVAGSSSQTWQEAVETCVTSKYWAGNKNDGIMIYQTHYVPSKRWRNDASEELWMASPNEENPYAGPGFLRDDNQTDPWVKGNDVWVMAVAAGGSSQQAKIRQEADFIFRGIDADGTTFAWDSTKILHRETPLWNNPGHNMWLLKILNDSIIEGTKDVRDHTAYQLIDRLEIPSGDSLAGRSGVKGMNWSLIRKPSVVKGNLERMGGGNETAESSEWFVHHINDTDWNNDLAVSDLGLHKMDPVTNYLSTVTSVVLKVTPGYTGDNLSITGNISEYNSESIALVLDKADNSQTFKFMRGDAELSTSESLADGDLLVVTSGNEQNQTVYKLVNSPLDNDTSLTAKAGSGLTVSGNIVSGVSFGMTLKEALSNLEVSDKSVLNVLDAEGNLQPLQMHNLDSLVFEVLVSDKIFLQVVAENNDKAIYSFDLGFDSSEAILLSNIIQIDQEKKLILELPLGSTALSMLEIVYANEGATIRILDKSGIQRFDGIMYIDDVIVVTAPDGVTKVTYTFIEDENQGNGVNNIYSDKSASVLLYPNPANNVLNFKTVNFEVSTVKIFSLSGTVVLYDQSVLTEQIDISNLPSGIYMVKASSTKGQVAIEKFIKK